MSGQISENPILTELSELLSRPVETKDLQRARLHLLDWIGCAIAGTIEPAGEALRARPENDTLSQAFMWGGLGNILEMDDVDKRALLHPGPSIVPAVLAVAQSQSTTLTQALSAIVIGYEATIRLGRAVGSGHYALWHSTGTCGPIGAAAASAHLMGLSPSQTAHAMALAVSQSAGLWHTRHDPCSMGKQLHTAAAARAGVDAAQLASVGFAGPLRILEGEQGFFAAMCPGSEASLVLARATSAWAIHDVSFKPWPACRHAHAVIDAALALRDKIDPAQATDLIVRTYSDALKFCDQVNPSTVIEAKFSLQHSVAVAMVRGAPTLADFSLEAINDPELSALRSNVKVEISEAFDAAYPARFGAAVSFNDLTETASDALGDPENPMSYQQIREKADMLMKAGLLDTQMRERIITAVLSDDATIADVSQLLSEALA